MAQSKVPKFGAWEGGKNENYTAYFDNARKKKTNGPMINPNDPQENPDMFKQNEGPAAQPSKGPQSQGPQFGAWDNGEVGYTAYFENKRKAKNGQPSVPTNEPHLNRDILHPQAQPQLAKLEPQQAPKQEARSKVPQFGAWEGEGEGEVAYTQSFDNVSKNNKNGRTVTPEPSGPPPAKEGRSKVPQFGAWEEGDNGAYTAYFENARKPKNVRPVLDNNEPQLNRDINNKARHPTAVGTKYKIDDQHQLRNASKGSNSSVATSDSAMRHGRQNAGGRSPIHQKAGKLQQKPPAGQGSQTPDRGAAIPAWGVWNTDPSQAEGFTGAFERAKEERNTPLNSNAPPRYNQPQSSQDGKKGCCFGWF